MAVNCRKRGEVTSFYNGLCPFFTLLNPASNFPDTTLDYLPFFLSYRLTLYITLTVPTVFLGLVLADSQFFCSHGREPFYRPFIPYDIQRGLIYPVATPAFDPHAPR